MDEIGFTCKIMISHPFSYFVIIQKKFRRYLKFSQNVYNNNFCNIVLFSKKKIKDFFQLFKNTRKFQFLYYLLKHFFASSKSLKIEYNIFHKLLLLQLFENLNNNIDTIVCF